MNKCQRGMCVSHLDQTCVQARKLDDEGTRLASQLTRLLLTRGDKGPAIDLCALCIIRGTACWALYIDCIVMAAGGSPLMALCAGIHKALQDTRVPRVSVDDAIEDASAEDIEVDLDAIAGVPVDVSRLPVVLTACQVRPRVNTCCKLCMLVLSMEAVAL